MNCRDIEALLASGQKPPKEAVEHILKCADCQQAVEFEHWLHEAFAQDLAFRPEALARVQSLVAPHRPRPRGRASVLRTVWTAACAAVLAFGFIAISSTAAAFSARAKFADLKEALNSRQGQMDIGLNIFTSGKGKTLQYTNGWLIDYQKDAPKVHPAQRLKDGSGWIVELKDLTPEVRKQVENALTASGYSQAIQAGSFIITGDVACPEGMAMLESMGINLHPDFNFNFNEANYSRITFGESDDILLLTPKGEENVRYELIFDPKTNLPSIVTMQQAKNGEWADVESSKFEYKLKEA